MTQRLPMVIRSGARALLPALLALTAGCHPPATVPAPSAAIPFRASSLDNDFFALVGFMDGTYTVEPAGVRVFVKRATLRVVPRESYSGPREVRTIRAALGQGRRVGSWWPAEESNAIKIGRVMRPGDELTLDSLRFFIPFRRTKTQDARRWMLFVMEERRAGDEQVGTSYVHGRWIAWPPGKPGNPPRAR